VPADLNELTEDALSEIQNVVKSRIIKDFQKQPLIRVDPSQIKKVITNLILNAEEATAGSGMIHLATSIEGERVTLAVSDNGCGMPADFIESRLFKPFATTKANGFGIGLYQAKSILEAHGGKIQVQSQLGQGSTFKIYVPIQKE
jgi:signal transduction histidine kinase